jgi:peptide/nickel transport system substrate-binding protein
LQVRHENVAEDAEAAQEIGMWPMEPRQRPRAQAEQLSDPTGSRALRQRVDREITDASPWVPLIASKDVNFISKRVGNYHYSPAMGMLIDQLWVR